MGKTANPVRWQCRFLCRATLLGAFLFVLAGAASRAQEQAPEVVEVYWQSSKSVSLPGVTHVVVLDESICRAQVSGDQAEFFGLSRGETLAYAWIQERRISIQIRVITPPIALPSPSLSDGALDSLGRGYVGSSMQTSGGSAANREFFFLHHLEWQQKMGEDRLSIHAQAQDSTIPGAPLFNANSASLQYSTPHSELSLIDFPLNVNGGLEAKVSSYSAYNVYMIRGADFMLRRGANQFELFSGVTIPSFYLTLQGTSDVAGFNFNRKQSEKLYLYSTAGWVNSPVSVQQPGVRRENSFFQTAGAAYRPDPHWALQGTVGGGTRGELAQGTISYLGGQLSSFLSGTTSSADFPLNQLQLFFAGGSSLTAGATYRFDSKLSSSLYFQHSATEATAIFPAQGVSDYLNPSLSFLINPQEALTLNYAYTRNHSGLTLPARSQGQRLDVALNSRLSRGISNTAQFTLGALSEPLALDAQSNWTARDVLNVPTHLGFVTIAFQHTRTDPSLLKRLNEYASLLPPGLQQLLLLDAGGFTQSSQLPSEVRALLENLSPTDTEISASAQLRIRNRLNLSPTVGYIHNAAGLGQASNSHLLGYTLSYQATPSLQLVSSLSSVMFLDPRQGGMRRTTVMTVGFNKSLRGTPRWLLPFREPRRTLRGRVFRDLNVNGAFNEGEPGLPGVRVDLNSGDSVLTDSQGRYEFTALKPGAYQVSVPLNQFAEAVRATGPTDVRVDLFEEKMAEVDFGIVNFGRIMGNVFNDLLLDGTRQPDANALPGVRLLLAGPSAGRGVVTDGTGDYEFDEISPGDYVLTVDRASLPLDFMVSPEPIHIRVAPTSTIVEDIPLRALRSISGHIYLRTSGNAFAKVSANGTSAAGDGALRPLAGIQVAVDKMTATTDADGGFILRDLPAGEMVLTLVPTAPLPPGYDIPKGKIRMPRGPVQAGNTTIVISNPELLKFLLPTCTSSGTAAGGE